MQKEQHWFRAFVTANQNPLLDTAKRNCFERTDAIGRSDLCLFGDSMLRPRAKGKQADHQQCKQTDKRQHNPLQ